MDEEAPIPFKQYFPTLSLSAYFWFVVVVSMLVFSILGYFVGIRVNELPFQTPSPTPVVPQQAQGSFQITVGPNDDNDIDYSNIIGSFVTDTKAYDQFVITVDALPNATTTVIDSDNRSFDNPHIGIQYPYVFSRLNPSRSYEVSASACRTDPQTFVLDCAKNIKITKCSGKIQGKTCVIKGNGIESQSSGEVDFSL